MTKHDTDKLIIVGRGQSLVLIGVFLGVVLLPWIAGALGVRPTTVENRSLASMPSLSLSAAIDEEFWSRMDNFLTDHIPLRQESIKTLADLQGLADVSASTEVFKGTDGVLFLAEEFTEACAYDYEPADLATSFAEWQNAATQNGKDLLFVVAPDKSSILTDSFGIRERAAAECAEDRRLDMVSTFAALDDSPFLPLWARMRATNERGTQNLYYKYDSHWTFAGAAVFTQALVEEFASSLAHPDHLKEGAPYTVSGDAARRLGRIETEVLPALRSEPPGITTALTEVDIDGTRTIREYVSESAGQIELIPGHTLVLHDSFMNFAEAELAPYFEEITFVHWHDMTKAGFFEKVPQSDRLVIEVVERNLHLRADRTFLAGGFGPSLIEAFATAPAATSPDELAGEVLARADALRSFVSDTQTRPTALSDLSADPGTAGWAGPYLDPTVFPVDDPSYGEWRLIDGVDRDHQGGLVRCEMPRQDCGLWLLLTDVPTPVVASLDLNLDSSDGLNNGDVRLSSQHGILYYWVTD